MKSVVNVVGQSGCPRELIRGKLGDIITHLLQDAELIRRRVNGRHRDG
jgi:hypothetical protein